CPDSRVERDPGFTRFRKTSDGVEVGEAERKVKREHGVTWRRSRVGVKPPPFSPETCQQTIRLFCQSGMAAQDNLRDLRFLRVVDCNDWSHARPQKLRHCISVEVCRIGRGYEAEAFVSENSFTQKGRIDVAPLIEHTDQKRKRARSDFGNLVDKADSSVQHCSDEWRHHVVQFSAAFVTEANGAGEVLCRNILVPLKDVEVFAGAMSQLINEAVLAHTRLTQQKRRKRLHARTRHPGGCDQLHFR